MVRLATLTATSANTAGATNYMNCTKGETKRLALTIRLRTSNIGLQGEQREPRDAQAVEGLDLEPDAVGLNRVPHPGHASQPPEHVPGDGVVILVQQGQIEGLVDIFNQRQAVEQSRAVGQALNLGRGFVEVVAHFADDLATQAL